MERLKIIDPEGFKQIQKNSAKYRAAVRREKKARLDKVQKVAEEQGLVALAQESFDKEGITKFRFVPADGILATVAFLLAVGHSRLEVAEKLNLDPELIKRVTPQMVAEQKKNIGMETIIRAANQKVAFDLTSGDISNATATADRIATGRMKLLIDANNSARKRGMLPSEIEAKEQAHADRFGAARDITKETEA